MPFTLVGWDESQDSATLAAVAALADPHVTVAGDDIRVPAFASKLIGVYAGGVNITRAQLQAPSLRRLLNYEVSPIDIAALPSSPNRAAMFPSSPLALDVDENLEAFAAEDGAGATRSIILAWLADNAITPVDGEIHTVRVTAAITAGANAWTNGSLSFDQVLPVGKYAIVGAAFRSTTMIAFRFVFNGGFARPGGLGNLAASAILLPGQRRGGWGVWGEFLNTVPPTLDILCTAADAAETGELDLIKIG